MTLQQNKAIGKWLKCQTGSPPKISPEADNEKGALVEVLRNLNILTIQIPPTPIPRRYNHLRIDSFIC